MTNKCYVVKWVNENAFYVFPYNWTLNKTEAKKMSALQAKILCRKLEKHKNPWFEDSYRVERCFDGN